MATGLLGQLLGGLFGNARGGAQPGTDLNGGNTVGGRFGSAAGGSRGGLGDLLGGLLGGGRSAGGMSGGLGGGLGGFGGKGAMLALLLPMALRWVQSNGGVGGVLDRFRQRGHTQQAASWVSTGQNESIDGQAMADVMGTEELSRLSQQLGLPQDEVSGGFAEILPEVVDQLTPEGAVPADADAVLASGSSMLEQALDQSQSA